MRAFLRFTVLTFLFFCVGWLVVRMAAQPPTATTAASQPTQADRDSGYEVLARGVVASRAFPVQFKNTPLRMEFRNYVMGKGITDSFKLPTQVLMEVRLGQVNATVNQQKHEYHQGDFWVVENGSSVVLENPGEAAVVRAIYIFEGNVGKP